MQRYEYRVVPAPKKGKRAKGVKGAEARFAHALSEVMNEMAADGWDYLRTDTLPAEERSGITGKATVFQNMLVFRRDLEGEAPTALIEDHSEDETENLFEEAEKADDDPLIANSTAEPSETAESRAAE